MRKRVLYTLIILFWSVCATKAQIDPLFFQQTQLRGLVNPAATGKGGDINASVTTRQQWIGFSGMSSNALMAHGFINELRSGIGAMFVMDEYGPTQTKNIKLNYAFFVHFDDFAFLSLGMGAGIMSNVYKGSEYFRAREPNDPTVPVETKTNVSPDFDFGVEFNTSHFEIGGSIAHITYGYNDQNTVRPMRNWYAYTRAKVPMNRYWDFIPGVTWYFNRWQTIYEVNAGVRLNNNLCVNVAYRNPMSLGMSVGLTVYEGFRLAYSYDYGFDNLMAYNSGSHEITISYKILMNTSYIGNRLRFFQWKMF